MYNVKDFLEDIDRINASIGHDKEWEKLRDRIFSCAVLSDDEILELESDVLEFLGSSAPEEDKEQLREYTESLAIVLDWVRMKRGNNGKG